MANPSMPCPQTGFTVGIVPPPADPLWTAIEASPPTPRQPEPAVLPPFQPAPQPQARIPFHLPAYHGLDVFWWSLLARAAYGTDSSWMTQVSGYANPVMRLAYVPPAAPPAVGHAFIELPDQVMVVVPGTSSDGELLAYMMSHALDQVSTYPDTDVEINSTWYERGLVVTAAENAWVMPAGKPIVYVGHSSGGATCAAAAMARVLAQDDRQIAVITYGSPQWTLASYLTTKNSTKSPQVIEFTTSNDPVTDLPPPFSLIDALGFIPRLLFPRPAIRRYGTLLSLNDADGARAAPTPGLDSITSGFQAILRGDAVAGHAMRAYTASASQWAITFCTRTPGSPNVQPLLDIMAAMNAADL
jgi:hypothetical protein